MGLDASQICSQTITFEENALRDHRLLVQVASECRPSLRNRPQSSLFLESFESLAVLPPSDGLLIRRLDVYSHCNTSDLEHTFTGQQSVVAQLLAGPSAAHRHFHLILKEDGSYHVRHIRSLSPPSTVDFPRDRAEPQTAPSGCLTEDRRLKRIWFSAPYLWIDSENYDAGFGDYNPTNDFDIGPNASDDYSDETEPLTFADFLLLVDCAKQHREQEYLARRFFCSFLDEVVGALEYTHYPICKHNYSDRGPKHLERDGIPIHSRAIATTFLAKQALDRKSKAHLSPIFEDCLGIDPFPSTFTSPLKDRCSTKINEFGERRLITEEQSRCYLERKMLATELACLLKEVEAATATLIRICAAIKVELSDLNFVEDIDLKARTADTILRLERQ